MAVEEIKEVLISEIARDSEVKAIGQTGNLNEALIPGGSDIDLFVLCTSVPSDGKRIEVYKKYVHLYSKCLMKVCYGGLWGTGDILIVDGINMMLMYFTIEEITEYIELVLQGKCLNKQGDFYPTGRLSSIGNMNVLYEEDLILSNLKRKVNKYPSELFEKLYTYHMEQIINEEDLGRVLLRKDLLFFHQVLENALDHFLQALYALNKVYFPSRKRSEQYIQSFKFKPENCYERLLELMKKALDPDQLTESIKELKYLRNELQQQELGAFRKL